MTSTLDDERFLPEFFAHLREYVDAFVVLDLGSRDGSLDLIGREPSATTIKGPTEGVPADRGRHALVERARELGATWVLWLDPDERLELSFAANLRAEIETAEGDGRRVLGVWARTLDASGSSFLAYGTYGLDHKYILFPPEHGLTKPPESAPPALRRLTRFSAYRLHAPSGSSTGRRLGVYAGLRPDPGVIDLQAQPPRTRVIDTKHAYHGGPAGSPDDEDLATDAIEQIFAACACEDWSRLPELFGQRGVKVEVDRDVTSGDPSTVLRDWWQQMKRWVSFASSELTGDHSSLVLYRGERRDTVPIGWCRLATDGRDACSISFSSKPPGTALLDRLMANAQRLTPSERPPGSAPRERPEILLSVIMPFYKRLGDFERVLPLNAPYFERNHIEVVVSMDEPSEEQGVLALIRKFPSIRWTVLVNDQDHTWRTPSRAINVGIRHAVGTYVLVVSPESAFVTDVPSVAERLHACGTGLAALGRVAFAAFGDLEEHKSLAATYQIAAGAVFGGMHPIFRGGAPYGSLCVERDRLIHIGGYDEHFVLWGGDDDNVRARLDLDGTALCLCEDMRIVHLGHIRRPPPPVRRGLREFVRIFNPPGTVANPDGWGLTYDRVAQSWR